MSFFRHGRSTGPMQFKTNRGAETPLLIVRDESHRLSLGGLPSGRARLRFAECAHRAMKEFRRSSCFQPTATCGLTGCLSPGVHSNIILLSLVELNSSLRRCITVVKSRGTAHQFDSREYVIKEGGMHLLPIEESAALRLPVSQYSSMLSRAPTRFHSGSIALSGQQDAP
jgi:hypothetical protein